MFSMFDSKDMPPCLITISEWLPIWEKHGVSFIPCEEVGRFPFSELLDALDGEGPCPQLDVLLKKVRENHVPGTVYRWDGCAPAELKSLMSREPWDIGLFDPGLISVDDSRFYAICEDQLRKSGQSDIDIILWRRPWIHFVHDSERRSSSPQTVRLSPV